MKLVFWNCRGLGGKHKLEEIKILKHSESMSILAIQGTKMQTEDCIAVMKKIWKTGEGIAVSSQGASGGTVTWWDSNSFKINSKTENHHCLFVELEDINSQEIFWIGNVYGPTIHKQKDEFWTQVDNKKF